MNISNLRIFVEKKTGFQVEAESLRHDLNTNLHLQIKQLRFIVIYDVFNIHPLLLEKAKNNIFSEPVTDDVFTEIDLLEKKWFAVEYLPGQFDQRADSAMQCLSLIDPQNQAVIKSGKLIIVDDEINTEELKRIKKYCINEVEAREKDLSVLDRNEDVEVRPVPVFTGFINEPSEKIVALRKKLSLAMSDEDLFFIQDYFKNVEKRDPSETEIKMLDTYWSDHCRHTTFETELNEITFTPSAFDDQLQEAFFRYIKLRKEVHQGKKPMTLMDMGTICGKHERLSGNLPDLEISEEINACSVYINVDVNGTPEKWLLMFKNETHNHPTEIEPFGGASTCIGGAIRDPLSGRSYVYQAMRVTGAGNITEPVEKTIEGKLPQSVISRTAAHGYSSYGNQIGLATTHVREIYHEGFKAKRMEIGAVVGAAPASWVIREKPEPGDVVIMFGGKTGRDGIGGATGSSKEHTETSLEVCAAEVQKGNAPEERKLQRLFRNPDVTRLIKRSNDFGAGGVSVAIGELADGLLIDLDAVPVKYKGLNGTEIALSESQERMSVVVDQKNVQPFLDHCRQENIEAVAIAKVTNTNRLQMTWNGKMIVDISRDFIQTNGIRQKVNLTVDAISEDVLEAPAVIGSTTEEKMCKLLSDLNVASQKGMIEMFDSTIGASTVLMPFGGKYQLTETQASIQKLPVRNGQTNTASILAFGYNPYIFSKSPFHGAMYAIIESMAKIVAVGGDWHNIRFTFQEYFEKLGKDPHKWGKPFAALLGAIYVQNAFHLPAIGGKDSMSGTFKDIHVPPTLVSFAVTTAQASSIISPEFKSKGNYIYLIKHQPKNTKPNIEQLKANFDFLRQQIEAKKIISAFTLQFGGIMEALFKMSLGNGLGFDIRTDEPLFDYGYGSFIVETTTLLDDSCATLLGKVDDSFIVNGEKINREKCIASWKGTFNTIYPEKSLLHQNQHVDNHSSQKNKKQTTISTTPHPFEGKVKVLIPVFPGTNCDYDTARAFEKHGAETTIFIFRNLNEKEINSSIEEMARLIDESQILAFSGGFSAGDEPDGSGKFIANVINNEKIKAAIERLLAKNYLIVGICNGFQALVKSGLLPFGKIGEVTPDSPTLTRNDINRHISHIAKTVVNSVNSPWLSSFKRGDVHQVAVSHGEGKFVVSEKMAAELFENGQVAFQYCDFEGEPSMEAEHNPNGSCYAIEGIVSRCGKILGKMGHSERKGDHLYKNISGNKEQDIFKNAVYYLKNKS